MNQKIFYYDKEDMYTKKKLHDINKVLRFTQSNRALEKESVQ